MVFFEFSTWTLRSLTGATDTVRPWRSKVFESPVLPHPKGLERQKNSMCLLTERQTNKPISAPPTHPSSPQPPQQILIETEWVPFKAVAATFPEVGNSHVSDLSCQVKGWKGKRHISSRKGQHGACLFWRRPVRTPAVQKLLPEQLVSRRLVQGLVSCLLSGEAESQEEKT